MKILPVSLIRAADEYTIMQEPVSSIDLMERAAAACYGWIEKNISKDFKIKAFCGSGNNGGDGLAIARMLLASGFRVEVFCLSPVEKMSDSCRINYERMRDAGCGTRDSDFILRVIDPGDLPEISGRDVVIDAIFGSGLARPAKGLAADVIDRINAGGAMVLAIDVPSGLFCDSPTGKATGQSVIRADVTLTFAPPKLAFFFPENDIFAGTWHLLDIGLSRDFLDSADVENFMLEAGDIRTILRKRSKFSHKGNYGHALIVSGSRGKMGAAVLSARACLRSGPGLVTMCVPGSGPSVLQAAVPEAMLVIDPDEDHFTQVPGLGSYTAVAVGPGIGTEPGTATALKILIQEARRPVIFDADAINILSMNKTWLGFIPAGSVFTPHPKEFERLAGKSSDNFERNRMQRDFSVKYQCYVVLKGAHTAITTPGGQCFFNTTGNPGMATGGSGDVLTGIITGLMAQGYSSLESCLLGVYIHGLAGDMALRNAGFEALIAGDITENLGKSFQSLYGKF